MGKAGTLGPARHTMHKWPQSLHLGAGPTDLTLFMRPMRLSPSSVQCSCREQVTQFEGSEPATESRQFYGRGAE